MHICEDAVKRLKTVSFIRTNRPSIQEAGHASCFVLACLFLLCGPPVFDWSSAVSVQVVFLSHSARGLSQPTSGLQLLDRIHPSCPRVNLHEGWGCSHAPSSLWLTVSARGRVGTHFLNIPAETWGAVGQSLVSLPCCHLFAEATPRS